MAEYFVKRGYQIQLIDLRGFGYSGGSRGTATLSELLKDLSVLVK